MTSETRLHLDPWPPEYDSAVQFSGAEESQSAEIDVSIETPVWKPIEPSSDQSFKNVYFVDGVRRVEARVIAEHSGQMIHGLFGSTGVGCVRVTSNHAQCDAQEVERFLILGGGFCHTESLRVGSTALDFRGVATASKTPIEVLGELQNEMRTHEANLAQSLAASDTCVFADGPLTYFATSKHEVIGIIKSIYLPYLSAAHFQLVATLKLGERTPLFAITDGKYDRYSWFLRVGVGRALDHPLTGIVRLEMRAAIGLEAARQMANFSARYLPSCASTSMRDARAPQNLLPIGALEADLRNRLGDSVLIHRAIESRLFEGITL